jgi:hypothetical protein
MDRRGIELSINFIVVFILGMAMFASGLLLLYKVKDQANRIKTDLDERTKQQTLSMLMQSENPIVIPYNVMHLEPGANDLIAIGIRNDLETEQRFSITTEFDSAFSKKKETICDRDVNFSCSGLDPWLSDTGLLNIKRTDREVASIVAIIPKNATRGSYIYNIRVCHYPITMTDEDPACGKDQQYDVQKKVTLSIE